MSFRLAALLRFALSLLLLSATPWALAVTYQVGPGRAHTQITSVANLVNPGDIIEVDGGATYNWVRFTRPGTAAQPIILRGMAQGAQRPVIDAQGAGTALQLDTNHYVIEDIVARNAATRCIYLHGHNLTLRRVVANTCATHGILGADTESGDMLLTEVEVYGQGNATTPSQFHHPIYIATDHEMYPNAVLRIEKSWVHDNHSGNSIKSRARTVKIFYNWLETTNGQNHTVEAIGPDGQTCPIPNGSNAAQLCNGEIVGNVLLARGNNANMMRLGGDGTGNSYGRYHVVNNTFIANSVFGAPAAMIRAFGNIESIELHNNIFWIANGDSGAFRIIRDIEAVWATGARKVTGSRNLITGSQAHYNANPSYIAGLTNTIFAATTAPIFMNINMAAPATLDLRLRSDSVARMAGHTGSTSSPGYEIPNPTNLPAMQPPRMRPTPGEFAATSRPQPTNDAGVPQSNVISLGAFEYAVAAAAVRQSDFNGDGRSDILWHNSATGMVYELQMNGLTAGTGAVIDQETDLNWKIAAVADLNGDGRADVVWQHDTTGQVYGLLMNGTTASGEGTIYTEPNTNWKIVGAGDFNGDSRADLLWKNNATGDVFLLLLNGLTVTSGGVIYSEPNTAWQIQKVADFNGDGRADVLWRNTATGDVYMMLMNGQAPGTGAVIYSEPNTAWQIQAAADFNGDGRADVLWRNTATGDVYMMLMNGTTITGGSVFYGEPNADWKIVASGDYNGDGRADILWRNTATGQVFMMLMNGFTISSGGFAYTEPDHNWKILGP